ncbi:MAG TPA: ComEC/Rec2 family competence protein, partial [Pseudomonadales bacterium]|nr:ComEC/Rec2 family competence protein [Pseudomonadales bacterium]
QQFSLVSPVANALAIPLVSLAITPLALAGALPFLSPLLWAANALTDGLMLAMGWLARFFNSPIWPF